VARWSGGERRPGELDRVPNDDQTVITGFIFGWEDGWRYVGPSPLKKLLGASAIGGRATVSKAPQPLCWSRGAIHFVWRPASASDPGDAFLVHVARSGETAALHTKGPTGCLSADVLLEEEEPQLSSSETWPNSVW
jgi:hypothetical protein